MSNSTLVLVFLISLFCIDVSITRFPNALSFFLAMALKESDATLDDVNVTLDTLNHEQEEDDKTEVVSDKELAVVTPP